MEETVRSRLLLQIMNNGLYKTDDNYSFYLMHINETLQGVDTVGYSYWKNMFQLLGVPTSVFYLFEKVWLEAYVRFEYLPKALEKLNSKFNLNLAKNIIMAEDLKYTDILKLKLAYISTDASTKDIEAQMSELTNNKRVQDWIKVGSIKELDQIWNMGFVTNEQVFDCIQDYKYTNKYSLDREDDIYFKVNSKEELFNVVMFCISCVNQKYDTRLDKVTLFNSYKELVHDGRKYPDGEYNDNVYTDAMLFGYLNKQALWNLIDYSNLIEYIDNADDMFGDVDRRKYLYDMSSYYSNNQYWCMYKAASEVFTDIYNNGYGKIKIGNMTFFTKGNYEFPNYTTVDRDFLSLVLKEYNFEDEEEMILSLDREHFVYFTEEEFLKTMNKYVPEVKDEDLLKYIWLDAYVRYYLFPNFLIDNLEYLCDKTQLGLLLNPSMLFHKNLLASVLYYCKGYPEVCNSSIDTVLNQLYTNGYIKSWIQHQNSSKHDTIADKEFLNEYTVFKSTKELSNSQPLYSLSLIDIGRIYHYEKEEVVVIFKTKLFYDTLTCGSTIGIDGVIKELDEDVVPIFKSIVGTDISVFTLESVDMITEFCRFYDLFHGKEEDLDINKIMELVHKPIIKNKRAASIFFGE